MKYFLPFIFLLVLASGCSSKNKKDPLSDYTSTEISGEKVYQKECVACHGTDGTMGIAGAKKLPESILSQEERETIVLDGKGSMPSFRGKLSPEEITAVAEYTFSLVNE